MIKNRLKLRQRVDYAADGVLFDDTGGLSMFNNKVVSSAYFHVMRMVGDRNIVVVARSVCGIPSTFFRSVFAAIELGIEESLESKILDSSIKQSARRSLWRK